MIKYQTHCADEHPSKDILLTGTTVTTNKDDWTITVNFFLKTHAAGLHF